MIAAPVRIMLDRVTGRITMYRLVLLCLAVILAAALVLSGLGILSYSVPEILASWAVAVLATVLSSLALAAAFRVRPHVESAIITGLLLLFLFRPTTDVAELGAIALAGVIASASKYLLAIRRRHIFNPAAIGALVVGLTQLNFAAWWVATPPLLPFTAIAAFVILYRTHRLAMGAGFIALSAAIITTTLVISGMDPLAALGLAFTSYPIVFLAGFMLSEPLTLPPRRWQQLALAGIVAVLLSSQFTLGPIYSSPELALVVGNAFAFAVGQRRGIRLRFEGRTQLTPTSWEFEFAPQKRVSFAPGQYMEFTLPHKGADARGYRRVFSIASAPHPTSSGAVPPVRFGLRIPEKSSTFKRALLALEPGALVSATSVAGDFTLPRDVRKPLLFVAGGIGITPFISQLEHLERENASRDLVIVYSSASGDELAYADRLAAGGHRVLLVSPEPPEVLPMSWTYLGAGPLTGELLLRAVPDATGRDAFVSGAPQLVTALRTALRSAGVRRVKTDYFSGY